MSLPQKQIILERLQHRNEDQIAMHFPKDAELLVSVKSIKGSQWSKTQGCWYVLNNGSNLKAIFEAFKGKAWIDTKALYKSESVAKKVNEKSNNVKPIISDEMEEKVKAFCNWMRSKRYADSTVVTYTEALKAFLGFYHDKTVDEISNNDIIRFNNEYILAKGFSASYQNQIVNAIKLFFKQVNNSRIEIELIHRPKRQKLLPNVLSKEEIKLILEAHNNLKHKAMLSLVYSCGLRCGELLKLKPEHIDSKRNVLIIKQAKGRKDRIAPLSQKIVVMLREYFVACKPAVYLFEGQTQGKPYDARSLQLVLKQALQKVNIKKPVSLHWLRHSYATHLLENGTDLRYIQEILGHSSSKTTEIYTHVSTKNIQNITSPFDYL